MTKICPSRFPSKSGILLSHLFLCVVWVFFVELDLAEAQNAGAGTEWVAPAGPARKNNPIPATELSRVAGRKIYLTRCAACHGKTGNGDGDDVIKFGLHPAKLSDPRLRNEPDGALYWKITTGKRPMPDYGSRLSATDRWNVINYVRTLSQGMASR
jgi:mono/diheme cytochrome c family protein